MTWIFWGSVAFVFYTYVGYAVVLGLRRPRPVKVAGVSFQPSLSIAMVVRNEEGALAPKLENLVALDYPAGKKQIVVVSDGSTDRTHEILSQWSASGIQGVFGQTAKGKAAGLNCAFEVCRGEVIVFTDVRQKIEPAALARLVENFSDATVGCVSGELMLGDPTAGETSQGMGFYWRIEKQVRELESKSGSVVGATGALYAARRGLLPNLPEGLILDDVYIPMMVAKQGLRVLFEPRARAWDTPNLGDDREFKRKVRTLTGNYQLLQVAPWLLTPSNPLWFEFVSHKLFRLLVPFALVAMLVSSAWLSGMIYRTAFVLQLAFYALSGLAMARLKMGPLARVADAALTFVVLNTAAAVAFANFVTGRKAVWAR